MPDSVMTLFPQVLNNLEALKIPLQNSLTFAETQMRSVSAGFDLLAHNGNMIQHVSRQFRQFFPAGNYTPFEAFLALYHDGTHVLLDGLKKALMETIDCFHQARAGELEFLDLFTDESSCQDWTIECDASRVLLDLPGLRVIDVSRNQPHRLRNFTVVFAPRAGHHSNIAERVALFLRDSGLTRMAVVEQKCAEDIPLYVDGKRHHEDFCGQVEQYRSVLAHLKKLTGRPPHLVAICQPGPLLMTTLMLNPELGQTFGSAGSPMNTDAERGFLTEFARGVGPSFIDHMITLFGHRIGNEHPGSGRISYDGRLQVLGFYLMGYDLHLKNLKNLLNDLKKGSHHTAERQKAFYQWYNTVYHFPAGFIRDTFKQIFIKNALIRDEFRIGNRTVGISDYPATVPIWALGGAKDNIAPPLQATGHMDLIPNVPAEDRLNLLCEGGHMALFRSRNVLERYYSKIAEFMLDRSDPAA